MDGKDLKEARLKKNWTQQQGSVALHVTQAYLSMMESGRRPVSAVFARKAHRVLNLPATAWPLRQPAMQVSTITDFSAALGALGYPGFAYLRTKVRRNPAQVLLEALNQPDLESRVVEGLPWLAFTYVDMDWGWLVRNAKLCDRQNRLGFTLSVAGEVADRKDDRVRARSLGQVLAALEGARLAVEDTFCHNSMTGAEKAWLRDHRSPAAAHWNLLTDMKGEHIVDAFA